MGRVTGWTLCLSAASQASFQMLGQTFWSSRTRSYTSRNYSHASQLVEAGSYTQQWMTQLLSLGFAGRTDSRANKVIYLRFKSRKTLLRSLVRLSTILALEISKATCPFNFFSIMWFSVVNSHDPWETRSELGLPRINLTVLGNSFAILGSLFPLEEL